MKLSFFTSLACSVVCGASTLYDVEFDHLELRPSDGGTEIEVGLKYTNRMDPFLVFDYEVSESIAFLKLDHRGFLLVNGSELLSLSDRRSTEALPNDFSLKKEGSSQIGTQTYDYWEESVHSLEYLYYHESLGSKILPIQGAVQNIEDFKTAEVLSNSKVSLMLGKHGKWESPFASSVGEGKLLYFVELWGKSLWKREVAGYYLDPSAKVDSIGEVDFPFEYKKASSLLNLIVDDGFAYTFRPDLSRYSNSIWFVSDVWSKVTLVYEIPESYGDLKLAAQFAKMGLMGEETQYLNSCEFTVLAGTAKHKDLTYPVNITDSKDRSQLVLDMALESDLKKWGFNDNNQIGLVVQVENKGTEPGVLNPLERFWFGENDSVFSSYITLSNPYAPPSELYLVPGEKRKFLLLFDRTSVEGLSSKVLNYSGIGEHFVLEMNEEDMTLVSRSYQSSSQTTQPATNIESVEPDVTPNSKDETDETPFEFVVPYKAAPLTESYDAKVKAGENAIEQLKQTAFNLMPEFDFETFENVFGSASIQEVEENSGLDMANPYALGTVAKGGIEKKGKDYWTFSVPDTVSNENRFQVLFSSASDTEEYTGAYIDILDENGSRLVHRWARSDIGFSILNIGLAPGNYYFYVSNYSDQPAADYLFQIDVMNTTGSVESESNYYREQASYWIFGDSISGSLDERDDRDCFEIDIPEDAQGKYWNFLYVSSQPDDEVSVVWYDEIGNEIYWNRFTGEGVGGDFSPVAGKYFVQISGSLQSLLHYHLQLSETERSSPSQEIEPNDAKESKSLYVIEELDSNLAELNGHIDSKYADYFVLNATERDRLYTVTLNAASKMSLTYVDSKRGDLASISMKDYDAVALVDLRLPLGRNYFRVSGEYGDYSINVEDNKIPFETYEWEPNNRARNAQLIEFGSTYQGRLLDTSDDDYYRIVVHQAMEFDVKLRSGVEGEARFKIVGKGFSGKSVLTDQTSLEVIERYFLLPGRYDIKVEARTPSLGFYSLAVKPVNPFETDSDASLFVETKHRAIVAAAYSEYTQHVKQTVFVRNDGSSSASFSVVGFSTHGSVRLDPGSVQQIRLEPGESKDLLLTWVLQPQIPSIESLGVFIGVQTDDGVVASVHDYLKLSSDAIPLGISGASSIEEEVFAGGFNLNLKDLGGQGIIPDADDYPVEKLPSQDYLDYLMDGVLARRSFYGFQAISQLAGSGQVPIVGTSIDLHGRGDLWESARDFSIDISDDGKSFEEIFHGKLLPKTGEQRFVFKSTRVARFARLRLHNTHAQKENQLPHVGEWRIIGEPGVSLPELIDIDLLDKQFGGHLIQKSDSERLYGFQHGRAARMDRLVWKTKGKLAAHYWNPSPVKIEVSMDSPVGPWEEVGIFDLSIANTDPFETSIKFEGQPWARFVKLSWGKPAEMKWIAQPEEIQIIEKKVGSDYRSVMGHWGEANREGYYEWLQSQKRDEVSTESLTRIRSSNDNPYLLSSEQWVSSVAWVNEAWEDWYQLPVSNNKKQLELIVEGHPFVKVAVEVIDDQGQVIKTQETNSSSTEKRFVFIANPGIRYRVHVYEPKRSIIYLWDVSGSMSAFVPSIENAVLTFSKGIDSKAEKVQLLPFEEPPYFLLKDWSSDSFLLQDTVRNYEAPDSSYAHLNLLAAVKKLKGQEGTKAAIVITDCQSSRRVNDELWRALEDVKPSVFTFQTSDQTSGYTVEQDDMQDWAAVGGGFYHKTAAAHELDTAFERVQAYLRRPAPYRIQLIEPELGPSFIEVVDSRRKEEIKDPTKDAVLLIIDVSASMRDKLPDGQMKASAAKKVIQSLVDDYLPDGVNFGLRVFGHRGSNNCESELMIPVGPLDRGLVKQKLLLTRTSSLGNTALAESLAWSEEDLGALEGHKRIVVLTDGEETCQGDPGAVIADLASKGLDVSVNIVGFTLGDESVKSEYGNWVRSTGGKYFDAQNTEALGNVLMEAMTPVQLPRYQILGEEGQLLAEGQVGDPAIKVDSGFYTVKILDPENPTSIEVEAIETTVSLKWE